MEVSSTGLIYLSIDELLSLQMDHLVSGVDQDHESGELQCGSVTRISGFTEWVSSSTPTVTIGWDWHLQTTPHGWIWSRIGPPSSNVMLLEALDETADHARSQEILSTIVDAFPWRDDLPALVGASSS